MPGPVRRCWLRLRDAPFECLIAGLAIATSLIGLLQPGKLAADPLDMILPHWAAVTFLLGYLLSGLCLATGLASGRGNIEAAGLVIIATSQAVRAIATAALLGAARSEVSIVFAVLVVAACWIRLHRLLTSGRRDDTGGRDG